MVKNNDRFKRWGILTSFLIGLPIGFIAITVTLLIPSILTGEGLPLIGVLAFYGIAILGLIVAFIFSLWWAGKEIGTNLLHGDSVWKASLKYSTTVNIIVWSVFILLTIAQNLKSFTVVLLLPPLIAFVIGILITPISFGLLICKIVNWRMKMD